MNMTGVILRKYNGFSCMNLNFETVNTFHLCAFVKIKDKGTPKRNSKMNGRIFEIADLNTTISLGKHFSYTRGIISREEILYSLCTHEHALWESHRSERLNINTLVVVVFTTTLLHEYILLNYYITALLCYKRIQQICFFLTNTDYAHHIFTIDVDGNTTDYLKNVDYEKWIHICLLKEDEDSEVTCSSYHAKTKN